MFRRQWALTRLRPQTNWRLRRGIVSPTEDINLDVACGNTVFLFEALRTLRVLIILISHFRKYMYLLS